MAQTFNNGQQLSVVRDILNGNAGDINSLQSQNAKSVSNVASLLADTSLTYAIGSTNTVVVGNIIQTRAENFSYQVAASGAANQHLTTAGGVKLYALTPNVQAFGAVGNGVTNDTAAIQAAVTAQQGKSLYFPNGVYVNTANPTGADDVMMTGEPFTTFSGTKLPLYNPIFTGNQQVALVAAVLRYYLTTDLDGSGYVNGETVTLLQQGNQTSTATATITASGGAITGITLISSGTGYVTGVVTVVGSTSSNGRARVSSVGASGEITGLTTAPDGWYLINDLSNANHDPILLGPVTASGAGSLILDVDFNEFGIDPNIWTPSGFVCGPDETFIADGVSFGASVGTTSVTIAGSFAGDRNALITWTTDGVGGGTLSGSNAPYIFTVNVDGIVSDWTGSGANRVLRLYRNNNLRKAYPSAGKLPVFSCRRATSGIAPVFCSFKSSGTTTVGLNDYEFFDVFVDQVSDATQITDATNQTFAFVVSDPGVRPSGLVFNEPPPNGSNIWMVGVFTRRASAYP